MRIRLAKSIGASVLVSVLVVLTATQRTAADQAPALKTPWGEPDLQDPLQ